MLQPQYIVTLIPAKSSVLQRVGFRVEVVYNYTGEHVLAGTARWRKTRQDAVKLAEKAIVKHRAQRAFAASTREVLSYSG